MEKLGIILAFYALLGCIWWVISNIKGPVWMVFLCKIFGFSGCIISIVYILKHFNII